jgi:hypothetical protein
MTEKNSFQNTEKYKAFTLLFISSFSLIILVSQYNDVSDSIRCALRLCASNIIPSIFPFFIFADFLASGHYSDTFSSIAARIFGVSENCVPALICGTVCGFPSGVKWASELYKNGVISKKEFENIIGIVNIPSFAFSVCAVGLGMMKSLTDGLIIYLITVLASIISSRLFCQKGQNIAKTAHFSRQSFSLSNSIKNAGFSSLVVSSYIIFFSIILKLLSNVINNENLYPLLSSFIEIGNATFTISQNTYISPLYKFILLGFSLGFSGISVHLQAFALLPPEISKGQYIKVKFSQGIICAILFAFYKII